MGWVQDPDGNWVEDGDSGRNITGVNTNPAAAVWRGAQRPTEWQPPTYQQTYGNYTGLFPSMGQQVGQALWGSVQAQNYQPSWMQTMLPSRQNNNRDMSKYSPFQSGSRTMSNPYPLNGAINLSDTRNIGNVTNAGNPFIGTYSGLGGSPGGGATGGNGLTPMNWGTTGQTTQPPPAGTFNPPVTGGTTNTPTPGSTGGGGGTFNPPVTGATGGQPPNPFTEPAPGSGGQTAGPGMYGQPYQPPTQGFQEPAPGSGGQTQPGMSMYGSPFGAAIQQVAQRLGGNKGMQISPQMISGLLGMFGGGK